MAATGHVWHDMVHDMRDEMHDLTTITHVEAARQGYLALWATFIALPLVFGLDKLLGVTATNWEGYLAGWVDAALPGGMSAAVMWIGAIEIVLALLVFAIPRVGGALLALWMVLAAVSLFAVGEMIALGVGALALGLCALAMARMSVTWHHTEG
jgi:hypothetical protein